MTIKEYILENKEKIGLALLGLAAVGSIAFWFSRSSKKQQKKPVPTKNAEVKLNQTSASDNYKEEEQHVQDEQERRFTELINQIRSIFARNNDQITPEVISKIISGQYALANNEVKQAIFKSRNIRRKMLNDPLQYAKIITRHQLQLEQLQERHLGAILARFNIDKVTWKEANEEWETKAAKQGDGISELIGNQEQKQLLSLRDASSPAKDIKAITRILQWKVKKLKELNPQELGVSLGSDQAARYEMIESYINDLVFKQFGVEPQDMEYSIEKLDKSNKQKVIQFQDQVAEIMDQLIYIQDQEEQEQDNKEASGQFN